MIRIVLLSCLLAASLAAQHDVRQNFDTSVEAGINQQIRIEFKASYVYLAMSQHFGKANIALPGFAKFFRESSQEEWKHATMLLDYMNKRGGEAELSDIPAPTFQDWSPAQAVQEALTLEKRVNQRLLDLHKVASDSGDIHAQDFLESNFLGEQVDSIKELGDLLHKLKRAEGGLGEIIIDGKL